MTARLRSRLGSESGAVAPGTVIYAAIAALVVYLLLGAAQADPAHFGRMPFPGSGSIELNKGEIQVYYAEDNDSASFALPDNVNFGVSDSAGTAFKTNVRGADPKSNGSGTAELVGSVSVPEDGVYTVTSGGTPPQGAVSPELTFGESSFGAIKDRFRSVLDSLIGPTGVLVLALFVLLSMYPRMRQAMKPPPPTY